jgi:subtilase family serine protease
MPSSQTLQLDLVLPLRDPAGLQSFVQQVSNPASSSYRKFLTPSQFTARFGPTQNQYEAVLRFAHNYGLEVVGGSRDAMDVQVKGTVAAIETAFHVDMRTYQHPTEDRVFFAADREPTVDLPFSLWHISGLDNYSVPRPLFASRSHYAEAHGIEPEAVVSHATTGSGPSASYLGSDMRAAYYGNGALTGVGQNVGLLEYVGTDLADLTTYYKKHRANEQGSGYVVLDRRHKHQLRRHEGRRQLRRHRADSRHDAGAWHGAGP